MTRSLVTGGTGFVGLHVVDVLRGLRRSVTVLGRTAPSGPDSTVADLTRGPPELGGRAFDEVYHVAGLAHVTTPDAGTEAAMQAANVEGTRHLLAALDRTAPPAGFVLVSTVAVYGLTSGTLVPEETDRSATDPYGASRRTAEDLVTAWGAATGVRVAIVRLPLVAGAGAPGQLGAMVRAMGRGRYLGVGDGSARRSMVLADDVARVLPRALEVGGTFHLTDGDHPSFRELEEALARALGRRRPRHLPTLAARAAGTLGDLWSHSSGRPSPVRRDTVVKMTSTLTFDDTRARASLEWQPSRVVDHAAELVR